MQQNDLVISGQKTVPTLVEATATFRVAEVRDNILSLENWFERVSASIWVLVVARWKRTARKCRLYLERNSLRVEAHVLQRASRPGYVAAGTVVTDERG